MRIALMADIHGNPIALDAVLEDIEAAGGVDECWVLGDLVAIGHRPVEVLERLCTLPNVRCARGNTDRYVCTGDRPGPTLEEAREDVDLMRTLVEISRSFAWTQGALTSAGWFDWLSDLPHELRALLPDGPGCWAFMQARSVTRPASILPCVRRRSIACSLVVART